jgi:hypothetical protein
MMSRSARRRRALAVLFTLVVLDVLHILAALAVLVTLVVLDMLHILAALAVLVTLVVLDILHALAWWASDPPHCADHTHAAQAALSTWLVYYRDRIEVGEWPSTGEAYVSSIYWALTTMSTIGYGDIYAVTNGERIVSIAIMLVGSVIFGVVVGGMTNMVAQLDSLNMRAQERRLRRMHTVSMHAQCCGACTLLRCMHSVAVHAHFCDACTLLRCTWREACNLAPPALL